MRKFYHYRFDLCEEVACSTPSDDDGDKTINNVYALPKAKVA